MIYFRHKCISVKKKNKHKNTIFFNYNILRVVYYNFPYKIFIITSL